MLLRSTKVARADSISNNANHTGGLASFGLGTRLSNVARGLGRESDGE